MDKFETPIPVGEMKWPPPGPLYELTCKNHTTAKYYWKGLGRSLHFIEPPEEYKYSECPCPFSDMLVVGGPE